MWEMRPVVRMTERLCANRYVVLPGGGRQADGGCYQAPIWDANREPKQGKQGRARSSSQLINTIQAQAGRHAGLVGVTGEAGSVKFWRNAPDLAVWYLIPSVQIGSAGLADRQGGQGGREESVRIPRPV